MSTIEQLTKRVSALEEMVSHLNTHHDEQFLMVHDDATADACERLFNVNLREHRKRAQTPKPRKHARSPPTPKARRR
jgi:hypothetical protein